MFAITQRDLIRSVARRWARQYERSTDPDKLAIRDRLFALDPETTIAADVNAIIGNSTWTDTPKCDECKRDGFPVIIELGAERDYDSNTARLCLDCLELAVSLARRVSGHRS